MVKNLFYSPAHSDQHHDQRKEVRHLGVRQHRVLHHRPARAPRARPQGRRGHRAVRHAPRRRRRRTLEASSNAEAQRTDHFRP